MQQKMKIIWLETHMTILQGKKVVPSALDGLNRPTDSMSTATVKLAPLNRPSGTDDIVYS